MRVKLVGRHNLESGISTLEVLIAMAILVTTLSTVILVVFGNQDVTVSSQNESIALYRVSQLIEEAKSQGAGDFNNLVSSSSADEVFTEGLLVTDVNPCKKNITASVSWSISSALPQAIEINTVISNLAEAVALGGDCGSNEPPISEWWHPDTFTEIDLKDFGAPNSSVIATGVDIVTRDNSKYMLLSVRHPTESVHDFWVFNVDDSANPVLSDSINTGTTGPGLNDIDGSGNFAFAANHESTNQLQVIDMTDLGNLNVVASTSLPGIGNSYPEGKEIFHYGDRVYVGTLETAGNEFQIFNVSNPSSPSPLGSRQINHSIRNLIVKNYLIGGVTRTIAYLAISASTVSHNAELIALDVTNPASITEIGSFNFPGDRDATALYALSNKLYVGRESGSLTEHNLFILDISDPTSITYLGSRFVTRNPIQALGITALVVSGDFIFLGTDDSNAEFQVFRASNPATIQNCSDPGYPGGFSGCGKYDFPQKISDLEFYDNFIYASIENNATFRIIYDNVNAY